MTTIEPPSIGAGLGKRSAVALGWGVATGIVKIALTLVVQAALARMLGPGAFGIFALGVLVMGVASYFADIGLATSLVQRERIDDDDVRFVLTLNLVISAAVCGLILIGADLLAAAFQKPEAAFVFRAMAPVFVVNAFASVSTSLLRRELDYRTIQLAGLTGYMVGFGVVGLALAAWSGGVSALIGAFLTQSAVSAALLYAKTRHVLGLRLAVSGRRSHIAFGGAVLATNLVNWLATSLDRLVIGRAFASAGLGLYSAATNLIFAPVNVVYPNLQSTVFSSTARMQGDIERQRRVYLDLLKAVAVVAFPAFAGVFFIAPSLVVAVYGAAWSEAADFACAFSLMAPFLLVWGISTPLLWNTGRSTLEARIQLPFLLVAALALQAASAVSLRAVAWTAMALFAARSIVLVLFVMRALAIRAVDAWRGVAPAFAVAAVVAAASAALDALLDWRAAAPVTHVLLGGALTALVGAACVLVVPSVLPDALRSMVGAARRRAPPWLGPVFQRVGRG